MFLKIKKSDYMNLSLLKRTESYICRIPKHVRKKFDLKVGTYVKLKNNDREVILCIQPAYLEDMILIPDFEGVFVTSRVANILGVDKPNLSILDTLTLGMDPEAFIVDSNGFIIEAENYFKEFEIGNDCGLVEFRPNPSTCPIELTATLGKLIKRASNRVAKDDLAIVAASCFNFKPAGFHIHFGYNCGLRNHISQIKLIGSLLDYILSILLLKKEIREDKFRRGNSKYGKASDIKRSRVSFEYRVPGGRLMESPILSIGAVSIAEIAVKDFLIKCNDITSNMRYLERFESYSQLQSVYPTLPSKDIIKEVLSNVTNTESYIAQFEDRIVKTIHSMDLYNKREKEIQNFLNYISTYQENNLINHWNTEYKKLEKSNGK